MKNSRSLAATVLALTTAFAAAQSMPGMAMPAKPAASASATMPLVQGEVRKLDLAKGLVVLRHGDIPNLAMPAMTMGYDVADKKMLDGLNVGDKIEFQAEIVKGKATVTELKRK